LQRARADAMAAGSAGEFTVRSSEYAAPEYQHFSFVVSGEIAEENRIALVHRV
jgi:hypothetical protein